MAWNWYKPHCMVTWYQCHIKYIVPISHNSMEPMHDVTLWQSTLHIIMAYGTNVVPLYVYWIRHTKAWHLWHATSCMSHYGITPIHVTLWHGSVPCMSSIAWYKCMSYYGMVSHNGIVPMHIILWHNTNAYHATGWYQCMSHYDTDAYISHYSMVPMYVTLWHGTHAWYRINACHTMAWHQCMSHYDMTPMHVTLWHDTNAWH